MKFRIIQLLFLFSVTALAAQTSPLPKNSDSENAPKPESFAALLINSPFKPVLKNKLGGKKTLNANYQFRGILTIAGQTEFGLYDAQAQRCYWLKLRERDSNGFFVENYNAAQKTLNVQTPAGRQVLALANPEEKPLANVMRTAYSPNIVQAMEKLKNPPNNQQIQNDRRTNSGSEQNNRRRNARSR